MKSKRQNTEYLEERLEVWQESATTDRRVFLINLGMVVTNATMIGAGALFAVEGDIVIGAMTIALGVGGTALSTKITLDDIDDYVESSAKVKYYQSELDSAKEQ